MRMLHAMNPIRLNFIRSHVGKSPKDLQILDIGCGAGILSEPLARQGANVTGLDENEKALEIARQRAQAQQLNINYIKSNSAEWAAHSTRYDIITAMEVIEHVPNPKAFLQDAAHLLKPDGVLFLSTINRTFLAKHAALTLAENILGLLPKGTHTFERFVTPQEMEDMAHQAGLSLLEKVGIRPTLDGRGWTQLPTSNTHLWVNYMMSFKRP